MALSVVAVSSNVSPLFTELAETDMLITSAPKPLARQFETGPRPRAVLEEQVDQCPAAQQVALRLSGAVEKGIALGEIQQRFDLRRVHAFDR